MPKTRHGRRDKKQVRKEPPAGFGAAPQSVFLSFCLSVFLFSLFSLSSLLQLFGKLVIEQDGGRFDFTLGEDALIRV